MENTSLELFKIIAPLFWITTIGIYGVFYLRRRDQENRRFQEMQFQRQDSQLHYSSREIERNERYLPKMMEEYMYRLGKIEKKMERSDSSINLERIIREINKLASPVETTDKLIASDSNFPPSDQIIKELSHALNTPLAQMEAATETALADNEINNELRNSLASIQASINICKSFLAGYRELALVSEATAIWAPETIHGILGIAASSYGKVHGRVPELTTNAPDKLEGYSNSYIASLILPIIENAIEGSKKINDIEVKFSGAKKHIIRITSNTDGIVGGQKIYETGYSTKKNHEGTGLASVKTLLGAHNGANITHKSSEGAITFSITLPKRSKS